VPDRGVRLIFVTGPDAGSLEAIGRVLVEARLAACVNVCRGVTSVYRWEGRVNTESEALAIIKTTDDRVEALQVRVAELHPYEVPEFVAVEVSEGSPAYLRWVRESTAMGSPDVEA